MRAIEKEGGKKKAKQNKKKSHAVGRRGGEGSASFRKRVQRRGSV